MASELYSKIENATKDAMKAHDNVKRDCLRFVISEIKNQTINAGKEINDEACLKVLQKSAKTHNDSIAQFSNAGRTDLLEKEKAELDIINSFLPKMMDDNDIELLVKDIVHQLSSQLRKVLTNKDMGTVMKAISSSKEASSINMKTASRIAASVLA